MPWLGLTYARPAAAMAMLSLAGCSGGLGGLAAGPMAYQASNAIAPTGYSETLIGHDK